VHAFGIFVLLRVTTCLGNLEMSRNLTAVREMSGILLNVRGKILSGKSGLKLFVVSCIFVSIQVFSRSLNSELTRRVPRRSAANCQGNVMELSGEWSL